MAGGQRDQRVDVDALDRVAEIVREAPERDEGGETLASSQRGAPR